MSVIANCQRRTDSDRRTKNALTCEITDTKSEKGCLVNAYHIEGGQLGNTLRIDVGRCDKGVVRNGKIVEKDE